MNTIRFHSSNAHDDVPNGDGRGETCPTRRNPKNMVGPVPSGPNAFRHHENDWLHSICDGCSPSNGCLSVFTRLAARAKVCCLRPRKWPSRLRGGIAPRELSQVESNPDPNRNQGAVLIVVLWILIILGLMVSTMAFEMHIEANITSYYRKRFKSQQLARAGVEWAKMMLSKAGRFGEDLEESYPELYLSSVHLNRGLAINDLRQPLGEGEFRLRLVPEKGRRNINRLDEDGWKELLDQGNVPDELWDELIDAFMDWTDKDDAHRLHGAESDDSFYEDRGYEVKNDELDTLDELLLVKGFTPSIVYGGPPLEEDDDPLTGIARTLTTWGSKVNVNAASRDVLLLYPEIDEFMVDAIFEGRAGVDGVIGTEDDGFSSLAQVAGVTGLDDSFLNRNFTTGDLQHIRVTSIGNYQGIESGIWCVFEKTGNSLIPRYWREEQME